MRSSRQFVRHILVIAAIATFACMAVTLLAQEPKTAAAAAATPNLAALHDRESSSYNSDCLSCHADILKESSTNPRIPGIHQKMLPYTPGYSPTKGPTNATCQKCHFTVDYEATLAGGIRKQVSASSCALCHSPAGPGKPLYRR